MDGRCDARLGSVLAGVLGDGREDVYVHRTVGGEVGRGKWFLFWKLVGEVGRCC